MLKEENILECTLITSIFSYGAYQNGEEEVRVSEIKGMMRYVYRMSCPMNLKDLAQVEAELFGSAARNKGESHGSPVRLLVFEEDTKNKNFSLLSFMLCGIGKRSRKGRGAWQWVVLMSFLIQQSCSIMDLHHTK